MALDRFLNLLIDANLFVLVAALAFLIAETCLRLAGFGKSYAARLRVLTWMIGFAALLPLVTMAATALQLRAGPHVSDILVSQYLKGNLSMSAIQFDTLLSARNATVQAVQSGSSMWITAGAAALLTVILWRLAYVLVNVARIVRLIRGGSLIRRAGAVDLYVSDAIDVPFSTRGLRRFYVVVPQALLMDGKTLAIAIGHEFQHIRQRDVTVEVLLAIVSPLFVFNPAFWLLSQRLRKLREHACDVEYLRRSRFDARDYARALLTVARQAAQSRGRVGSLSVPFIGRSRLLAPRTKSGLADRMLAFSDGAARVPHRGFVALLLGGALALMVVGASALQPVSGWSHDRIMISSVANLERLSLRNGTNTPTLGVRD